MKMRSVYQWDDTSKDFALILQVWGGSYWVDVPTVTEDDVCDTKIGDTFIDTEDL